MIRFLKILSLFSVLAFSQCSETKTNNDLGERLEHLTVDKDSISAFLTTQIQDLDHYDRIIIIPTVGCNDCINEAEQYFIDNYSTNKDIWIFTFIDDLKQIRLKLGSHAIAQNLIIDHDNKLMKYGYISIYPIYMHVSDLNKIYVLDYEK